MIAAAPVDARVDSAGDALSAGDAGRAVEILVELTRTAPGLASAWQLLGFAYREEQCMVEAAQAFARAVELAPDDLHSALGHAQTLYESGLPAAHAFRIAEDIAPQNLRVIRGHALALAAEGRSAEAEQRFVRALESQPDWLEGHRCLAALRWTAGRARQFAASYAAACRAQPGNLALRLAWFRAVAPTRDWDSALAIIEEGERLFGAVEALTIARLFIASESGDAQTAEQLFDATQTTRDDVRDLAFVRHCLRAGQPERALAVAERMLATPSRATMWPYLSVIWRLLGDARAGWLDGSPPHIRVMDLDFTSRECTELAAVLRDLHVADSPYLEQSVRGGTQTDGQLFFRTEPLIQKAKRKIEAAVREYVAALSKQAAGEPQRYAGHPLLGESRRLERVYFSGSWSVRLGGQGYHVSHTHPLGWISSAFYVALPPAAQLGVPPAGWISFGTPPPDLKVDLSAYAEIEPRPGRLVLFPSTMWHRTVPFDAGERLVVAFDVRTPRRPQPPGELRGAGPQPQPQP